MQKAHTEPAAAYAGDGADGAGPMRPTRALLRLLQASRSGTDPRNPTPETLREQLAGSSEACLRTIHLGLGALGQLVARCAMDLQDGTVPCENIENLGYLMTELGDLATECMRIAGECRGSAEAGPHVKAARA